MTYAIDVYTEDGRKQHQPTGGQFRALLASLGWSGDEWLVAEPVPVAEESFFQVLRESETWFRVEIRAGGPHRHVAALVETPEAVERVLSVWAAGDDSWRGLYSWESFELLESEVEPDEEVAAKAIAEARALIACGFQDQSGVAQAVLELFSGDEDRLPIVHGQAMRIVERIWQERLAEQADWPERTDPEAVEEAFETLTRQGIIARADFTCCSSCGHAEIGAEIEPDSVGYVFFHSQATHGAVDRGRLYLQYGAFGPDRDQDAAIGRRVVEALTAAGLPTEWDGDGSSSLVVAPIAWQKRLE